MSFVNSKAKFSIALKERHHLTQSALNFAVGQTKQMMANVLDYVKESVKQRVGEIDVDIDDCFEVDPFDALSTEYLQTKFYREQFNLVVSPINFLCIS